MSKKHGLEIILEKIKNYPRIFIHGHSRPDGDCYGAQFGLKDIISTTWPEKEVYVVGETSDYVSFVGTPDIVKDDSLWEEALVIVVDTATEDRVSDQRYKLGKEIIKIDHHIQTDANKYGNYIWVEQEWPSCAQMIMYFYYKFKDQLKMTEVGAQAMYTGIVTDTGRFRFRGVDKLTHQLAGLLVEKGAEPSEIDSHLSSTTMAELRLKGYVYDNFKTTEEGFIYFLMTREVIDKFGLSDEDSAAMVNELAGIEGYPVWALIVEYPDSIRIRFRSNGPEVATIANQFGGGGHDMAAGGSLESWDDVDRLVNTVNEHIKNWKKERQAKLN